MIDQQLVAWGRSGNIIREIAEYGTEQAKIVGPENVYNFTIGSPSIDPPPCVFETMDRLRATVPAAQLYTYAPAAGLPEVREKAAAYLTKTFGVRYRARDVIITCGTSTCLAVMTRVLLSGGGRAMTFTPYFMDYKYYADAYGAGLTECPTDPHTFQLDLDAAEKALTSDTMLLILNSPNNPSGVVLRREGLEGLARLLERKQAEYGHPIYILADEPYRELVYDGQEVVYLPSIYKNTIYCYSFSKSMSLPGERVGFMALPPELDDYDDIYSAAMASIRAFGYICVSSMWQRVAIDCLGETSDISVYKGNRDLLYGALTEMGYTCVHPDGAFYLFMKTPEPDATAFCRRAMKDNLLVVPGDSFGTPGYVRLAYCVSRDVIERSLPTFRKLAEEYGIAK
ncbi:MAG: pyridoxal phosphate-dependent aminotransferase [Oscillospiraceae bacterium]|nr:pyridoxal phosphate-dependent aminotransferase [Oscillospiraceae bacterium]